ncbi:MAG: hypothetical protein M3024_16105 [Candidatus Dormibacteraeota bacterium]|nr:hypothetical protein [Candidatus Dormibacteraeota bacterium]
MSHAAISLLVLAIVVVLFVWNYFPVEIVAIGSAVLLFFTGVLTVGQVVEGLGIRWSCSSRRSSWSARVSTPPV